MKADILMKTAASSVGFPICPSQVEKTRSASGKMHSFKNKSKTGATSASPPSNHGTFSVHLANRGRLSFNELTSVKEDKIYCGIVEAIVCVARARKGVSHPKPN
jgi:hypothetical protein